MDEWSADSTPGWHVQIFCLQHSRHRSQKLFANNILAQKSNFPLVANILKTTLSQGICNVETSHITTAPLFLETGGLVVGELDLFN